MIRNY